MKRTMAFSTLFLLVFGLSMGLSMLVQDTQAEPPCLRSEVVCWYDCTTETGPLCTNPNRPYYAYNRECGVLPGHHCHNIWDDTFAGCCNGPE